jgi:phosphoglycerate kinase
MANTFLRALGLETGDSLVEDDRVSMARDLLDEAGDKLLLPVDVVIADEISPTAETRVADRTAVPAGAKIGDIGPRSREIFEREVAGAGTVLWNGPLGVFEMPPFSTGTLEMARILADASTRGAMVVLGGGDSAAAAVAAGVSDRVSHISTGGGASLDLLAGKELPGVAALDKIEVEEGALLRQEGAIGG